MATRVKADFVVLSSTARSSPPGVVWKVNVTVFGSRRSVFVSVKPPESVAVSFNSR